MKRCDEEVKRQCKELINGEEYCDISHAGIAMPIVNDKIVDKNINVMIREIDAKKSEEEAVKEKAGDKWTWVDVEARNCFYGGVGIGTLKCVNGYNHHGKRDGTINKGLVPTKCPRCGEEEDWAHVIKCQSINHIKEEYVNELRDKIGKVAKEEIDKETVEMIVSDIKRYVNEED